MVESLPETGGNNRYSNPQHMSLAQTAPVLPLDDIDAIDVPRFGTGIEEFDRVLAAAWWPAAWC